MTELVSDWVSVQVGGAFRWRLPDALLQIMAAAKPKEQDGST